MKNLLGCMATRGFMLYAFQFYYINFGNLYKNNNKMPFVNSSYQEKWQRVLSLNKKIIFLFSYENGIYFRVRKKKKKKKDSKANNPFQFYIFVYRLNRIHRKTTAVLSHYNTRALIENIRGKNEFPSIEGQQTPTLVCQIIVTVPS